MFKQKREANPRAPEQGHGRHINYHRPPMMRPDQIFERYIKEIEEDFQFNHRKLNNAKQNQNSEFTKNKEFMEKMFDKKNAYNYVKGEKISL